MSWIADIVADLIVGAAVDEAARRSKIATWLIVLGLALLVVLIAYWAITSEAL